MNFVKLAKAQHRQAMNSAKKGLNLLFSSE